MITSYKYFKLLFLIGYLSFYIILTTADPLEIIQESK